MKETRRSENVCTKQRRIAQIARQRPQERLSALNHYLDIEWLAEACHRVRREGAPGVDGQTVADYGEHLEANLRPLLDRAKSGTYCAPPVKRVHIPKDGSTETRPIGMPTTEDKVLQRSVAMLLEPICEEAFHDFSHGFRPRRSPHRRCKHFGGRPRDWECAGCLRSIFGSISIAWIGRTYWRWWANGSEMECFGGC